MKVAQAVRVWFAGDIRSLSLTIRSFLAGPARFAADSPIPVIAAIVGAMLILVASQGFAALMLKPVFGIAADPNATVWTTGTGGAIDAATHRLFMALLVLSQAAMIALTLAVAAWGGFGRVLNLRRPVDGWGTVPSALTAMAVLVALFNFAATLLFPDQMASDLEQFRQIARAPAFGLTAMAVGLGASFSEELLFRGLLLAPLAGTRLGYWPAAVVATLAWTLLHLNFSWLGLVEVFLFGLYFSWLLWRSGSLWPAIICHSVYNSGLLVVLRHWPG